MTELIRVARGFHVPAPSIEELDVVCGLALRSSAPDSVFTGTTAARLRGYWLPTVPDELHIATASPGRPGRLMTRTRRPEIRAHRLQLVPDEIELLRGLPVMTAARTWCSLATSLSLPDLVAAGDSALRSDTTVDELAESIARRPRARSSRMLRTALPLLDVRSRSHGESHLRVAISASELPRFEVNEAVFRAEGGWLAEPDLSLVEAKIALEYQGSVHADVAQMRKDLTRSKDLRDEGWTVLAYGPAETYRRPWQIATEVRRAVEQRAPRLLVRRP